MPIVNYAEMKTVFMPRLVSQRKLLDPCLLIKAINYLTDSKDECGDYAKQPPGET
jgi:hypothetical protein